MEEAVNKKADESKKKKRTSLKSILGGDILFLFAFTAEERFDNFQKFTDRPNLLSVSGLYDFPLLAQFSALSQH